MTTLADDLLLVLLDPASGKPRTDRTKLDYGLAGALLLDLALAERVDVEGSKPSRAQVVLVGDAALADRQEDLQATTVPLQVLVFVPFFAGAYVYTPGTLLTTLSYVPFTAPIAMPRRLALGDASWWEGALAALLVAATAVLLVAVATRIYERSLLRSGGRLGWVTALGLGRPLPATIAAPEGA